MQLKNIIKLYINHKAWTSSITQNDSLANTHCCSVLKIAFAFAFENPAKLLWKMC